MKKLRINENDFEAQALNEEVTANAATSVNNVPACEGEVDDLHEAGGTPADEELDSNSNLGEQEQKPLMKERVIHTLKKKTLGKVLVIKSNRRDPKQIKAKQKSCRKHGMLVSALFADATAAFDGVCEGFGIEKDAPIKNKVLKGTFIWNWTAKKIHEADEDSRIDVADRVINMFTSMSAQESERINNAEKTEAQTREQVIHGILNEMYNRNK